MKRRHFLASLGTLPAGSMLVAAQPPPTVPRLTTDVLVIGGGRAGTIAAIQAGRLGAKTIRVEAGRQLGGTTTTGGVDFPDPFHAGGRQVTAGIGWDLVKQTVELNNDELPDFSIPTGPRHPRHQVRICGALSAALAEEACVQAGVQLRYYESPLTLENASDGWRVRLVGKGTMVDVTAKQLVDCTGSATAVGLAGFPWLRDATRQPGTLIFRVGGFDRAAVEVNVLQAKHADDSMSHFIGQ